MAGALLPRRGFLTALSTLPLIGGGIKLLGAPTAAAVPLTRQLLTDYIAWLANEHVDALYELFPLDPDDPDELKLLADPYSRRMGRPFCWFPDAPEIERSVLAAKPSTRAAVILSAAGAPLPGLTERRS